MCLRMNSPATNRVGNGGCPGPARQTEPNRPARKPQSISAASRTSGWRRLMISSRAGRNKSSWRSSRGWLMAVPLTANLAVEGITNRPNPDPKTQENSNPQPPFLQNRILAQVKSRQWFNRFRILHGRLLNFGATLLPLEGTYENAQDEVVVLIHKGPHYASPNLWKAWQNAHDYLFLIFAG